MEVHESQPKPINGFLILNSKHKFLEHNNLTWFDHGGNYRDAYVYTREELDDILERSRVDDWKIKPTDVIEATFDPSSGVTAHEHNGKMTIPISELPPLKK
ncbi:MAG: hypothetical protein HYV90_00715 [Candidatus Woesebacteria bacterium]|nr:MAG: hypothetical protein HYV90_00715 [Candidatus Woesebacteria bacterium]